jgi:hypothetical protein
MSPGEKGKLTPKFRLTVTHSHPQLRPLKVGLGALHFRHLFLQVPRPQPAVPLGLRLVVPHSIFFILHGHFFFTPHYRLQKIIHNFRGLDSPETILYMAPRPANKILSSPSLRYNIKILTNQLLRRVAPTFPPSPTHISLPLKPCERVVSRRVTSPPQDPLPAVRAHLAEPSLTLHG